MKKQLKELTQNLKDLKAKQLKENKDKEIENYYKNIKPGNIPPPPF